MPKTFSKNYANRKKTSKFRTFLRVLLWILIAVVILFSGRFMADLITGNVGGIGSGRVKLSGVELYVLSFGEFDDLNEAQACAVWVENSGGAGYLYNTGKYMVVGRTYLSLSDAQKVQENLGTLRYDPSVITLKVKSKSLKLKGLKNADKKAILNDLNSIKNILTKVAEIDVTIDRNGLTNIGASSALNSLKTEVKEIKNHITLVNLEYKNENLNKVASYCSVVEDALDLAVNKLLVSTQETSVCKYLLSEIELNYFNLVKQCS